MSIFLGLRMALAGGRESLARMVLMTIGIAVGVVLLLLPLTGLPILQKHIDRLAWHRTTATSPRTAPDPALWLAVTDRYAGRDIIRVNVAALGSQPPVPPGVRRLPGPGEVVVSPALAELLRTVPGDQLGDRFPGRVIGTIGDEGLIAPGELVGIVGRTPEEMRNTHGAYEIRGIEQPAEPLDLREFIGVFFWLLTMLIVGPVLVFVWAVTRIGGVRREQRFAAIRLAGASRLQTAMLAAIETGVAAVAGISLGWLGYQAARRVMAAHLTLGHGTPIFLEDAAAPAWAVAAALCLVLALTLATTLVALGPAQVTPLGVRQRARRPPPDVKRLAPLALGVLAMWAAAKAGLSDDPNPVVAQLGALISLVGPVLVLVGIVQAGPWVCLWTGRGLARLRGSATTVIVSRRIELDPYSAFRAVSGAAVAVFVATTLGLITESGEVAGPAGGSDRSVLNPGVVAVHVQGAPRETLAPLMRFDNIVIARSAPGQRIVVACAELSRVTDLKCPLPESRDDDDDREQQLRAEQLFALPHHGANGRDVIFVVDGFDELNPDNAELPIQTLFIPTDGTPDAQERIRTLAAVTVPASRNKTSQDLPPPKLLDTSTLDAVMPYAMAFIMLVAAAALTVSVVNGIMERRRPFALLRASGVRLGQLRRVVLLETGIPLAVTVIGGMGLAMLLMYLISPIEWAMPGAPFFIGLGAGTLAAFAVSLIALPLMDSATRHDSIRFE